MQSDEYRRRYYGIFPYYENDEEPDTHQEECPECHGKGLVLIQPITIQSICLKCKGKGSVDWIDHMTGNSSPHEISRNFMMNVASANVEHLIVLIKRIMGEIGEDIRVSVSLRSREACGDPRKGHFSNWIDY